MYKYIYNITMFDWDIEQNYELSGKTNKTMFVTFLFDI